MAARRLDPLDDIDLIGLFYVATIAFDCSGARFAEDIDEAQALDLLDLLDGLGDRVYFPDQAVVELDSLFKRKLADARDSLARDGRRIKEARKLLSALEQIEFDVEILDEQNEGIRLKYSFFSQGYSSIANRLLDLAKSRTSVAASDAERKKLYGEARVRYDSSIPPGFRDDRAWCDVHGYGKGRAKDPLDSYGDYVLWRQLLDFAIESKKPILLITNDLKRDWWDLNTDDTVFAPNSELREEMEREAGQKFYAITFERFCELAPKVLLPAVRTPLFIPRFGELAKQFTFGQRRSEFMMQYGGIAHAFEFQQMLDRFSLTPRITGTAAVTDKILGSSFLEQYELGLGLESRKTLTWFRRSMFGTDVDATIASMTGLSKFKEISRLQDITRGMYGLESTADLNRNLDRFLPSRGIAEQFTRSALSSNRILGNYDSFEYIRKLHSRERQLVSDAFRSNENLLGRAFGPPSHLFDSMNVISHRAASTESASTIEPGLR